MHQHKLKKTFLNVLLWLYRDCLKSSLLVLNNQREAAWFQDKLILSLDASEFGLGFVRSARSASFKISSFR